MKTITLLLLAFVIFGCSDQFPSRDNLSYKEQRDSLVWVTAFNYGCAYGTNSVANLFKNNIPIPADKERFKYSDSIYATIKPLLK